MAAITGINRPRRAIAVVAIALGASATVLAHDPGLSALDVRVHRQQIIAVLSIAAADADSIGGRDGIGRLALEFIEIRSDGQPLVGTVAEAWTDESKGVHARLAYEWVAGANIVVRSAIPARLLPGHRELVSIRAQDGVLLAQSMLDARLDQVAAAMTRPGTTGGSTVVRFTALGVQHILTGYDHLAFLAGVLVVVRRWRDVIQTITAFTIAHSITLSMAAVGVMNVPGRIVETLIAASIVYVGLENLLRAEAASRWQLTFGFGLVHGLGFATALRDLGIATGGLAVALPLASFNAGVEIGQIAVSVLLVPLFWKLSARPFARVRFASAGSLLVVLAGTYWLIQRIV